MSVIYVERIPAELVEDGYDRIKAALLEAGHASTDWLTNAHVVHAHTIHPEGASAPIPCHATEIGAVPVYRVSAPDVPEVVEPETIETLTEKLKDTDLSTGQRAQYEEDLAALVKADEDAKKAK